jgi:DNA-binding FrmR family transcriptional regulator
MPASDVVLTACKTLHRVGGSRKAFAERARTPHPVVVRDSGSLAGRHPAPPGTHVALARMPPRGYLTNTRMGHKDRLTMMDPTVKKKVVTRLRRIAGQVEGIARMIDDDRYCVDVLLQIAAAQAGLGQAGALVLRSHVDTCVSEAMNHGTAVQRKKKIDELMDVFSRYSHIGAG